MDEENISISFTDFESVSINIMKELWKDEDFTDVTLATSDGRKQLKAHKIVLSSRSSLFSNILREVKHQNPLIFLHDIHLGILEQILEFIYTGRCEIHQENLKMFLSCGKALGIQSLDGYSESEVETFKNGINKTELLSEALTYNGKILALEKGGEEVMEKMEHLQMDIEVTGSEYQTDKLDKCSNLQIGIMEKTTSEM